MTLDVESLYSHMSDAQRCMYDLHQPVTNTTVRGLLDAIRELFGEHVQVKALIERARQVSPSPSMAVYVSELERALGLATTDETHTVTAKPGTPVLDAETGQRIGVVR